MTKKETLAKDVVNAIKEINPNVDAEKLLTEIMQATTPNRVLTIAGNAINARPITVHVRGAKWFDRVNGNTYNNVKIVTDTDIIYLGFAYGYGSDYYYRACDYIRDNYGDNVKIIDHGAEYYRKTDLKNNNF